MSRPNPTKKLKTDHGDDECSASGGVGAGITPTCIIHCVDTTSDKITLLSDSGDGPGRLKNFKMCVHLDWPNRLALFTG